MGQTAGFAAGSWALFIDGPTGCLAANSVLHGSESDM